MSTDLITLEKQIAELQAQKKALLDEQRGAKLAEVKAIVQQFGFTASELGLSKGQKKAAPGQREKLEAKYANPKNPKETWHGGKGARPTWIKEFLKGGGKLEDVAIKS